MSSDGIKKSLKQVFPTETFKRRAKATTYTGLIARSFESEKRKLVFLNNAEDTEIVSITEVDQLPESLKDFGSTLNNINYDCNEAQLPTINGGEIKDKYAIWGYNSHSKTYNLFGPNMEVLASCDFQDYRDNKSKYSKKARKAGHIILNWIDGAWAGCLTDNATGKVFLDLDKPFDDAIDDKDRINRMLLCDGVQVKDLKELLDTPYGVFFDPEQVSKIRVLASTPILNGPATFFRFDHPTPCKVISIKPDGKQVTLRAIGSGDIFHVSRRELKDGEVKWVQVGLSTNDSETLAYFGKADVKSLNYDVQIFCTNTYH